MYIYEVRIDEDKAGLKRGYEKRVYRFPKPAESGHKESVSQVISHWGLCTIDIKDGDLTYQGIRLHTNPDLIDGPPGNELRLWQSEFSKISPGMGAPHAYLGYVMFKEGEADKKASEAFLGPYSSWDGSKVPVPPTSFHLSNDQGSKRHDLNKDLYALLYRRGPDFLRDDLDDLLVRCSPYRSNEIVSIIHIDLSKWLKDGLKLPEVTGKFQLVNPRPESGKNDARSTEGKRIVAGSGTIVWTPILSRSIPFSSGHGVTGRHD